MTEIVDINDKKREDCTCGTMLEHWEKFSGERSEFCGVYGCAERRGIEGAMVRKRDEATWYIIPLCKYHCGVKGVVRVSDTLRFVLADVGLTCGVEN